jgi:hypothetical protein
LATTQRTLTVAQSCVPPSIGGAYAPYGKLAVQTPEISAGIHPSRMQTCLAQSGRRPASPACLSRGRPSPIPFDIGIALDLPPRILFMTSTGVSFDPRTVTQGV